MKAINTHGLNINIAAIRSANKEISGGAPRGCRYDIFYDPDDGSVWAKFFVSENSWSVYHDQNIVRVCSTCRPMSAQSIADAIAATVNFDRAWG